MLSDSPADIVGVTLKRSPNVIAFPAMKRKNANAAKINLTAARTQKTTTPEESEESKVSQWNHGPGIISHIMSSISVFVQKWDKFGKSSKFVGLEYNLVI